MNKLLPYLFKPTLAVVLFITGIATGNAQRNPILGAGNSYLNISKKASGGVVQQNDTLEIRTTYFFNSTYNTANAKTLYKVRYYDSVPTNTAMITTSSNFLKLITNEGLTFRKYTQAAGDDAGVYDPIPGAGKYQIRINIGSTVGDPGAAFGDMTDNTNAGNFVIGTYKPIIFGGTLITTSYRVQVTGNAGDTIVLAAAKFIYKKTSGGGDTVISGTPYKIYISSNNASGLCPNALGTNLSSEFGGTFGNGTTQNRSAGPTFYIPNYDYKIMDRNTSIGDGNYSFVNNLSPTARLSDNARRVPNCNNPTPIPANDSCVHRMFGGHWDIIGDHTGTTTAAGNPATPVGTNGGYMLVVNSDVVTSEAYRQTVTGLCPDTYYEFSAWVKNICKTCAIDSNSTSTYKPGVLPNLAFAINGLDRYTTGQMDTVGWMKKGFVFRTGLNETSAVLSIRNNAPGGGGNDWAIDDIAIGTCGPGMNFNFKPFVGCADGNGNGTVVNLEDTVKFTFNPKYSWFKWERSTDNGATWHDTPTPYSDSVTIGAPVNGNYQFVTKLPQFVAYKADSGNLYRVTVATSQANLASTSCSFTDGQSIFLKIITCPPVLDAKLISLNGRLKEDSKATISWIVSTEKDIVKYDIERSIDGTAFTKVGESPAQGSPGITEYAFNDTREVHTNTYYRIKVYSKDGRFSYTKTIVLNKTYSFMVSSVLNPFTSYMTADIVMPSDGVVKMNLFDSYGKLVGSESKHLTKGLNKVVYNGWSNISQGMYYVTFDYNNSVIPRRVTKLN